MKSNTLSDYLFYVAINKYGFTTEYGNNNDMKLTTSTTTPRLTGSSLCFPQCSAGRVASPRQLLKAITSLSGAR